MPERPTLDELAATILGKRASTLAPRPVGAEHSKTVVALYLLGASQPQLATLYGVARETIKGTIVRKLSPTMRARARPSSLHKPILSQEQVALYRDWYLAHRMELAELDVITLAARLKADTPPLED